MWDYCRYYPFFRGVVFFCALWRGGEWQLQAPVKKKRDCPPFLYYLVVWLLGWGFFDHCLRKSSRGLGRVASKEEKRGG